MRRARARATCSVRASSPRGRREGGQRGMAAEGSRLLIAALARRLLSGWAILPRSATPRSGADCEQRAVWAGGRSSPDSKVRRCVFARDFPRMPPRRERAVHSDAAQVELGAASTAHSSPSCKRGATRCDTTHCGAMQQASDCGGPEAALPRASAASRASCCSEPVKHCHVAASPAGARRVS